MIACHKPHLKICEEYLTKTETVATMLNVVRHRPVSMFLKNARCEVIGIVRGRPLASCVAKPEKAQRSRVSDQQLCQAIVEANARTLAQPCEIAVYWDIVDELLQEMRRGEEEDAERSATYNGVQICEVLPWEDECKVFDV